MKARAPASSANLGPGFDVLAVALRLYVEVEVLPWDRLEILSEGEGSEFPADSTHLAAKVVRSVTGHDRQLIRVRSDIPVGRGLGSSAALAVAAAAAAGAASPLDIATAVDGHPENAAASVLGGLVTATMVEGAAVAHRMPLDDDLTFVLIVPDRVLTTSEARASLGATVAFRDATFNLGRLGLLLAGLADHRHLCPSAMDDRLHQTVRTVLFPEAPKLLEALLDAGAMASCWSGAGPSLLGVCLADTANQVARAARERLGDLGLPGSVYTLRPDHDGVTLVADD